MAWKWSPPKTDDDNDDMNSNMAINIYLQEHLLCVRYNVKLFAFNF